jgi:cytochrome c oxidase assembly factor CtaG
MDMPSGVVAASANFWGSWTAAPEITLALLLAEYLFLRKFANSTKAERRFFLAGLATIAFAVCTPFGTHAESLFWCHMVQHVTLMMVAGPLLVLGTPQTFRPARGLFGAAFNLLTNPFFSWISYAGVMIGVHLPPVHNTIMRHSWIHTFVEIPLYIAISYLFYFNLLDREIISRRVSPAICVISLFLMMVPETLTGFFIYIAPHSIYDGMFTLDDQRRGGSIMWSGGMIIDTIWMAFAVFHWIKSEERASIIVDAENAKITSTDS